MPTPVRFLQLSDLHLVFHAPEGDRLGTALADHIRPLELVRKALRAECAEPPDFLLLTGDLADRGGAREYQALRGLLREEMPGVPVVALPGNHDGREAFCRYMLDEPPRVSVDQVFDIDGLRVIALDTGEGGVITREQTVWIEQLLRRPAPRGTLLAMHHPLYRQSPMNPAGFPPDFAPLVARSDIAGIFCGHTHENYVGSFAGKLYVTADACSFTVGGQDDKMFCELCAGYVRAELGPHGLSVQMKRAASAADASVRFPI